MNKFRMCFGIVFLQFLSSCGGGATSPSEDIVRFFALYAPGPVPLSNIQTFGSNSTNTESADEAGYGYATVRLSTSNFEVDNRDCDSRGCRPVIDICELESSVALNRCPEKPIEPSENIRFLMDSSVHISDTDAEEAWSQGWTGLGETIAVIDDFESTDLDLRISVPGDLNIRRRLSHGEAVANIAGGNGTKPMQTRAITYLLAGHYGQTVTTQLTEGVGVAKDAVVVKNHIDLSTTQNVQNTINNLVAHLENSREMSAVNLSVGLNINTIGITYDELLSAANDSKTLPETDAVISVAAGNGGAACTHQNLNGCNALSIALAVDPNTNKNTILVGATTGYGVNEEIATYSSRGGMFAERFLLASGTTGYKKWDGGFVEGTSFAAPRVAGAAAILRHKFPNLSGSDASSILLLTASKDINNDGIDDFTGISQTFGHGKLDLTSALQPIGSLTLK